MTSKKTMNKYTLQFPFPHCSADIGKQHALPIIKHEWRWEQKLQSIVGHHFAQRKCKADNEVSIFPPTTGCELEVFCEITTFDLVNTGHAVFLSAATFFMTQISSPHHYWCHGSLTTNDSHNKMISKSPIPLHKKKIYHSGASTCRRPCTCTAALPFLPNSVWLNFSRCENLLMCSG